MPVRTLELAVCAVASVLSELPWAFCVPLLFYTLVAVERLVLQREPQAGNQERPRGHPVIRATMRVVVLLLLGVCVALVKDALMDGRILPLAGAV
jgi:hypothetical protein